MDDTTFVTGDEALCFYVDLKPPTKQRITSLIEDGGGRVTHDYTEAVIVITDKSVAASDSKIFLPPVFVEDSISFGQQVFQDYALPVGGTDVTTFAGRTHYTDADDKRIMGYLASHSNWKPTGNTVWQEMEREKVTKHSWNSMRTHYLKILLPKTKNGDVILTKKKKTATSDNDNDNTYSAFPHGDTKAKKTSTKNIEQKPIDEEDTYNNNNTNDVSSPDPFNTDSNENMSELLEHLLNSGDPPSPTASASNGTTKTPKHSGNSKKFDSKSKPNGSTKHTHFTPASSSGSESKSRSNSHISSSTYTTPITQTSTTHSDSKSPLHSADNDGGEYVRHKTVNSTTKKRAATERNMRGTAKKIKQHVETMAAELQLPVTLVYHALLIHSGHPVHAINYLLSNPLDENERPWLPSEDKILQGNHNTEALEKIMHRHGKKECVERVNFLESSTVSLNHTVNI